MAGYTAEGEVTYIIKEGTIVHINGIPLEILADVPAYTHPSNILLIEERNPATYRSGPREESVENR